MAGVDGWDSGDETQRDLAAVDVAIAGFDGLSEIGRGAFGIVYRAQQPEFKRFVAIKVLTGLRDARARRRFDRERQSVGSLSGHPNIVTVHASGFTRDGSPYLVMEYLGGGSLADRVNQGSVPWPQALETGAKLASAVQDAHDAGILHRDIKPENVLLSDRGEPKLADFGIASLLGVTTTGAGFTPVHAAPEVLAGKAASAASDVYSLASTIYTVIAGRPAFIRDDDDSLLPVFARIATEPVPDLRPRGIPDPVCVLLEHAMAKDPRERPTQAAEFGEGLSAVLVDRESRTTVPQPLQQPPPEPPQLEHREGWAGHALALRRGVFRRRKLAALLGAALVIVTSSASIALLITRGGPKPNVVSATIGLGGGGLTTENVAVGEGSVWAVRGTQLVRIDSDRNRVNDSIDMGAPGQAVAAGEGAVWVASTYSNIVSRVDPGKRTVNQIPVGNGPIAIAVGEGAVWVANSSDGTVSRIDPHTRQVTAVITVGPVEMFRGLSGLAVGSGSIWVANDHDGTVSRIDPTTNRVVASAQITDGGFSLDVAAGDGAVWASAYDSVYRIDPAGKVLTRIKLPPAEDTVSFLGNHPFAVGFGSLWIATSLDLSDNYDILRIDPDSRKITKIPTVRLGQVSGISIDTNQDAVWVVTPGRGEHAVALRIHP